MAKKSEQSTKPNKGTFTDMAESIEKKSVMGKIGTMLDEIAGDVRWGRKSLMALVFGGAAIGAMGFPSLMNALQPYVVQSVFTALMSTSIGAGIVGGTIGMGIWGVKGVAGTITAGVKTVKKHNVGRLSARQKFRRLKKSAGRLPAKDPTKLNIDSDKCIIRNGILMAVAEDAQGKNAGIRLVEGITAISPDAFKWDDMDKPLTLYIPKTVMALNLEGMPHNTRLYFESPMSKYELLDDLKYDPSLRKHVLGDSKFEIPGGTYQQHLYECEMLEEETARPATRWSLSIKEDLDLLARLPEEKQRLLLEGAYESMLKGGFTISDFRNIMRCSTIPVQEFKGPIEDHCTQSVINASKRQWYLNETARAAKSNPAITEMDALLKEIRRVAAPLVKNTPENRQQYSKLPSQLPNTVRRPAESALSALLMKKTSPTVTEPKPLTHVPRRNPDSPSRLH